MPRGRAIPGFPGYRALESGEIWSVKSQRILRPRAHHRTGHLRVRLYGRSLEAKKDSRGWTSRYRDLYVHVLICTAFHGPPPFEGALVLHWDDDPSNNRPENLRWGDGVQNAADRARNATPVDPDGFDWSTGEFIG